MTNLFVGAYLLRRLTEALEWSKKFKVEFEKFCGSLNPVVLERWTEIVEDFKRRPFEAMNPYYEPESGMFLLL